MRFSCSTPLCVVCRDVCFLVDSSDSMRFSCRCDWFDLAGLGPFQWTSIKLFIGSSRMSRSSVLRGSCLYSLFIRFWVFKDAPSFCFSAHCSTRRPRRISLHDTIFSWYLRASCVTMSTRTGDFLTSSFSMHRSVWCTCKQTFLENSFHCEDIQKLNF